MKVHTKNCVTKLLDKYTYLLLLLFLITYSSFSQNELAQLQLSTRQVANKILPSVVTLDTRSVVKVPVRRPDFNFFFDPFGYNNRDNNNNKKKDDSETQEYSQEGLGSGIIVRQDKNIYYVLTNAHVVADVDDVTVITHDDKSFEATILGTDKRRDLALVSFESKEKFTVATLGNSDKLQQGDIVFAVGNPYGFRSSITFGIISAVNRKASPQNQQSFTDYIQTDAAVNRGNSGGPLVNIQGEVIGINSWIYSYGGGGNEGLSFAVPINNAKQAITSFIEKGEVDYGWLGAIISDILDEEMASLKSDTGILISSVYDNSPADRGGVLPGDIILAVNGEEVINTGDTVSKIASISPGSKANLKILRNGKEKELSITLAKRQEDDNFEGTKVWPGFSVIDITDSLKERLDFSSNVGVVVTEIIPGSHAATAGIQRGDVIERINNKKIKNIKEFYAELKNVQKNEEANFRIVRDKTSLVIGLVHE